MVTRRQLPKKSWGSCNYDKRLILIRRDLSHRNMLDTMLHEFRHALHPILFCAEDWISDTSTELADALLASGLVTIKED